MCVNVYKCECICVCVCACMYTGCCSSSLRVDDIKRNINHNTCASQRHNDPFVYGFVVVGLPFIIYVPWNSFGIPLKVCEPFKDK